MYFQRHLPISMFFVLFLMVTMNHCMVKGKCYSDKECPSPQVCIQGTCGYECSEKISCPLGTICIDSKCIPDTTTKKPKAPNFAMIDVNPYSPTYKQEIALSDYPSNIVVLYFAQAG